jgi:hypothetical protein
MDLSHLEGRTFCVVFVKVLDEVRQRVQMQCFRGRASIERGRLNVVAPGGAVFAVPSSAYPSILPNDGTKLLKDAEYFVLVKTDPSLRLVSEN